MGITAYDAQTRAINGGIYPGKACERLVIAIAGNPNVGKSTVFNGLTGMKQHTGNWPGKTVTGARGVCRGGKRGYTLVDIPGAYSLMANSREEEVARDFICFGDADAVAVVCDGTCLERNLNLVLQILEITPNVVLCVNLLDEAEKKGIKIDLRKLESLLGVPVAGVVAREKGTLKNVTRVFDEAFEKGFGKERARVQLPSEIANAALRIEKALGDYNLKNLDARWLSLRLLNGDESLIKGAGDYLGFEPEKEEKIARALEISRRELSDNNIDRERLEYIIAYGIVDKAREIAHEVVSFEKEHFDVFDRKIDRVLTGKTIGIPVMIGLLALVLWITIVGANYPSQLLSSFLLGLEPGLRSALNAVSSPDWLTGILVDGVYRVLMWVVSVMLPPMAIFFPMFTLLEDAGYLPRVAYNLDKPFKRCRACGKQSLTMCMGFGCNAAAIIGCRIIDSPRERLLAILTNNFVPCNGRFPTLIAMITMFLTGGMVFGAFSIVSALFLTLIVVLGVLATLFSTKILSSTILKGAPSSFTLELPPYRAPQIGKVLVRSVFDRTLFVLGRAAAVAAPAGAVIWLMANTFIADKSLLLHCAGFLDPVARFVGLDGAILMAFILGLPANEIVLPIIIMIYAAKGSIMELEELSEMKTLFVDNGWTWKTAVSMIIFSLMHWPCATSLMTIKKETGSWRWVALACAVPTAIGVCLCAIFTAVAGIF